MEKKFKQIMADTNKNLAELRKGIPDALNGFSALAQGASKDGALDKKTKEFVALGIAVASRCDACIAFHCNTLIKLGATREEVMETLGMAVYMGGGPSLMYAAEAIAAFDELS